MYRTIDADSAGGEKERAPVLNTMEARQGETSGHVRIILATSLALALVAFVVLYASMAG